MSYLAYALGTLLGALVGLLFLAVNIMNLGRLYGEDFRGLKLLLRQRRFGLLFLFAFTAVVAISLSAMRRCGISFEIPLGAPERALFAGLPLGFVGTFAILVTSLFVGVISIMFSDSLEHKESRRLKDKLRSPNTLIDITPTRHPPDASSGNSDISARVEDSLPAEVRRGSTGL